MDKNHKSFSGLLKDIHRSIGSPTEAGVSYLCRGSFTYFHYRCDGFDDIGWGCGYRTLQSIGSLIGDAKSSDIRKQSNVPSIQQIQECLVRISDKPETFLHSREWIGALEVSYVIDTLYSVSCKILHVPKNDNLSNYVNVLKTYFEDWGGLIMMGGNIDASSKGIAGIHLCGNTTYLLVIDPHYIGNLPNVKELILKGYIRWQKLTEFIDSSFYNLCMPQIKC